MRYAADGKLQEMIGEWVRITNVDMSSTLAGQLHSKTIQERVYADPDDPFGDLADVSLYTIKTTSGGSCKFTGKHVQAVCSKGIEILISKNNDNY